MKVRDDLRFQYKQETGENDIYRDGSVGPYDAKYVHWLEDKLLANETASNELNENEQIQPVSESCLERDIYVKCRVCDDIHQIKNRLESTDDDTYTLSECPRCDGEHYDKLK